MDQSQSQIIRRFRANPIEVAIFGVISLIFMNSIYDLFYDHDNFHPLALTHMSSNPISEGRAPASLDKLATVEFQCGTDSDTDLVKDTPANKVRFNGPICGFSPSATGTNGIKVEITNTTNQIVATSFEDAENGKFSTDYVPLNAGDNKIRFDFIIPHGNTTSKTLILHQK